MKHQFLFLTAFGLILIVGGHGSVHSQESAVPQGYLELAVRPSTNRPFVGQRFELVLGLKNTAGESRTQSLSFRDDTGHTFIYVSRDGKNFGRYVRPGIRSLEGGRGVRTLRPDEVVEFSARVYLNEKPQTHSVGPAVAERAARTRILTDYVFPEAGDYFIKAAHSVILDGKQVTIESAPVKITIEEPGGEDLAVWKRIKDRSDIGFFIQEGWFRKVLEPDQEKSLIHELEEIVSRYPASLIAQQIRQRLIELETSRKKRKR